MDVTLRDETRNQGSFDYILKKLLLGKYTTRRINYANISGALETVLPGTVMGRVDATGKLVPMKSDASDGSQQPVCILLDSLESIAIAGTVDNVLVCSGGQIDKNLLVFAKEGDTLATTIEATGGGKKSVEDFLIQNGNEFEFLSVADSSLYDN